MSRIDKIKNTVKSAGMSSAISDYEKKVSGIKAAIDSANIPNISINPEVNNRPVMRQRVACIP